MPAHCRPSGDSCETVISAAVASAALPMACVECVKAVLASRAQAAANAAPSTASVLVVCTHGPSCGVAPNRLTLLHAAAIADCKQAVAAAAAVAGGHPDAELDRESKSFHLHQLLEDCGITLTDDKRRSKFYSRLHGCTPLELAVALGHAAAAEALLAVAGAAVRPSAWTALLQHCPPAAKDRISSMLAVSQVWWQVYC